MLEHIVHLERDERARAHAMGELDLREHDPREQEEVRDARADERPKSIQTKNGRERDREATVEPDRGSAPRERADGYGKPDLTRRRALTTRQSPDRAELGECFSKERQGGMGLAEIGVSGRRGVPSQP